MPIGLPRLVHAEALRATGEHDQALQAIRAAKQHIVTRANRITRPEWRKSFVDNVAENRRILELAHEWDVTAQK